MSKALDEREAAASLFFVFEDNLNNKDNCFIGYRFVFEDKLNNKDNYFVG